MSLIFNRSLVIFVFGFLSTVFAQNFIIELSWPLLLLLRPQTYNSLHSSRSLFYRIPSFSFFLFFSIPLFSIISYFFYYLSGWIDLYTVSYPSLTLNYVIQTIRLLLIPVFLYLGYLLSSRIAFQAFFNGFGFGLLCSTLYGYFMIFSGLGYETRLSGFSGEPKHLAALLSVYIFVYLFYNPMLKRVSIYTLIYFLVSLVLTQSFNGNAALFLPLMLLAVFKFFKSLPSFSISYSLLYFISAIFALFLLFLFIFSGDLFQFRTFNGLLSTISLFEFYTWATGKDSLSIIYLLNYPLTWLTGFGPGGLNLIYLHTRIDLATDLQYQSSILQSFKYGTVSTFMAPGSSFLYIASSLGFLPLLASARIFFKTYSIQSQEFAIPRYLSFILLTVIFYFIGFNSFLVLLFLVVLSGQTYLFDFFNLLGARRVS